MATLRDIRRRIRSVESTQKITRAMKLVAAAKLRRAQERIVAARPYAVKMAELLVEPRAARGGRSASAAGAPARRRRKRLVIITADKGLCGAFNSNILRASLAFLRERANETSRWWWWARRRATSTAGASTTIKSEMLGFFDRLAYSARAGAGRGAHAGLPRAARWTRST